MKKYHIYFITFLLLGCQIPSTTTKFSSSCVLEEAQYLDSSTVQLSDIEHWVKEKKVNSVEELLLAFPEVYRRNFSLVEHTKALGESNLEFPRIVLFGEDGHLLFNISSKKDDPTYQKVDGMELNNTTGNWELFQLDFAQNPIAVRRSPGECFRCHGQENPKPLWGTSNHWEGVFGDNEAPGPNGEALSIRHIKRMNEIKNRETDEERLLLLEWEEDEKLRSGGIRKIKGNRFGAELIVSNQLMGASIVKGIYQRMKLKIGANKERYFLPLILLTANQHDSMTLGSITQKNIKKSFPHSNLDIDHIYQELSIHPSFDFAINDSKENQITNKFWQLGKGNIYEQLALLMLYDLNKQNREIHELLRSVPVEFHCQSKDHTISSMDELITHKVKYSYVLSGAGKAKVAEHYLPLDDDEVYLSVLQPIFQQLQVYYMQEELLGR
ncbi:hypothetical protein MY04_4159 [Flammeovirga sp. MY04]|uniref:hypothetical protein n=1 Tax=Flammeovirga sp. MY04 TaxID=1191459 RepID=UPI0008060BBC|nr:hypothetical protein [Flammeovirga sp. MY04]ANQ51503.1 hypothetical protein MY04_4159 [Flammeovirga sp. MY04]